MFEQVPPELFARIFEIGIETWDIGFLPPLCLVCRSWNDLVISTPRLWGIIKIDRSTRFKTINSQIVKAKASPLTILVCRDVRSHTHSPSQLQTALKKLASLAHNWLRADVNTRLLSLARWADMRGMLQDLRLVYDPKTSDHAASAYFQLQDDIFQLLPKLHSFAADGISAAWVTGFLSPSITRFELLNLAPTMSQTLDATLEYLSRIPSVITLDLNKIYHTVPELSSSQSVHLPHLATLELCNVIHFSRLLCHIQAPSLQVLSIRQPGGVVYHWAFRLDFVSDKSMSPFFSQWSQGSFIPTYLHTLELQECLQMGDVPYLIRWLARLPNLVRLILLDDAIGRAADSPSTTEETNLFRALASPQGAGTIVGGWLCPSLMQLLLSTDVQVTDLIAIARARGGIAASLESISPPDRLRIIEAHICPSGNEREIEELYSLMDEVRCACLGCEFNLDINGM